MQETIQNELVPLQMSIDNLDAALVCIWAESFRCTQAVGILKTRYGLPVIDSAREQSKMIRVQQLAFDSYLDPDFTEKFLKTVIKEGIRHHEEVADKQKTQ